MRVEVFPFEAFMDALDSIWKFGACLYKKLVDFYGLDDEGQLYVDCFMFFQGGYVDHPSGQRQFSFLNLSSSVVESDGDLLKFATFGGARRRGFPFQNLPKPYTPLLGFAQHPLPLFMLLNVGRPHPQRFVLSLLDEARRQTGFLPKVGGFGACLRLDLELMSVLKGQNNLLPSFFWR